MKILRLRLNNLASLAGEHEIDFESAPLANAGLIAITGKTGAGKSTLLDAMCLALFDQVPRLTGAAGSLPDHSGQGIAIKDSKNMLRRGCASGFAELEFIALDQKRYLARWEIRRARNKLDGNLKIERAVIALPEKRVLTQKISECTPCIHQLIGLSFEQFTRAVLLAQSEVGAFLKAKDQERADLLEYLTNSNIFSLVGKAAFEKTKAIRLERENLSNMLGGIECLTETEVSELTQQQQHLDSQCQGLASEQRQFEQQLQWYQHEQQLIQDLQQKQAHAQQQQLLLDQQQPEQEQLQQLETFASIRSSVEIFQQQQRLLQQVEQELTLTQTAFTQTELQFQHVQTAYQASEQQLAQEIEFQRTITPQIQQAEEHAITRETLIAQYRELQPKISSLQQQQQDHQQQVQTQQQKLHQIDQQLNHLQQQLADSEDLQPFDLEPEATLRQLQHILQHKQRIDQVAPQLGHSDLSKIQQQLQQLNADASLSGDNELHIAQQQREQLLEKQYLAEQIEELIQQYLKHDQLNEEITQQLAQLQQQHALAEKAQQQSAQHYQQSKQAREHLQQTLQQQCLIHSQQVEQLRQNLQENQPCMVCGSTEHPFLQHKQLLEKSLFSIQQQQEKIALEQEQHAFDEWQQHQQQSVRLSSQLEQQQTQQQQTQQQRLTLQHHLENKAKTLALTLNFDQQQALATQIKTTKENLQQQQAQLQQQIERQQQRQQLQVQLELLQQWHDLIEPITQHLTGSDFSQWQQNPVLTIQTLTQRIRQRQQLRQQFQQQQQLLQIEQQKLQPQILNLNQIEQQLESLKLESDDILQRGEQLKLQVMALTRPYSDTPFELAKQWLSHLRVKKQQLEQSYQTQKQQFDQAYAHYQQQQQHIQQQQNQKQHIQQQQQSCQNKIDLWLNEHPDFGQAQLFALATIDLQTVHAIRQRIQQQIQALQQAQMRVSTLQEQHQQHLQQQPALTQQQVEQQLQQTQLDLQNLSQQRDAIKLKLELNLQNLARQQQFERQIEDIRQKEYRWSKISDLIGSADGGKFKKIAQEHHLDILVEYANQQLQPLAPRYQLQRIPNSLGLAIIDQEMNSEIRPVVSLSGGETFLVSLALALAIANMASGTMKLESLFIDEGFGTLDPASLHIVMDALDRLQSQGRKVVLISHVQEMHERIPVQIQVKSVGAGASTIHIMG
ncbi:AAA family ATPase [Acinetobacter sp.]|uniref:AAA family ATPase n=1 Tax=Acinetobacter sp. TaxID=472 RepID=UPI0031CFD20A